MGESLLSVRNTQNKSTRYVLDTNVLIHDPTALLNFEEHKISIPMTVLEELDSLKSGRNAVAADCRQAIRELDKILGRASLDDIEAGVPIKRGEKSQAQGSLSIIMRETPEGVSTLPTHLNDNKILNDIYFLQRQNPDEHIVLISKDINMRLKAKGCGIEAEDYHNDQLVTDIEKLNKGFLEFSGSFWEQINQVDTQQEMGRTVHRLERCSVLSECSPNQFILDEQEFVGRVLEVNDEDVLLLHLDQHQLMETEAWGLKPRDIYQACALNLLLDPDVHIVNLTGSAGSGKTILALAAAIEMTVANKLYRRIIATRSTQGLDEDIGFLPGTEAEKMEPWLGAITDNLEALHCDDEDCSGSVDYVLNKVPLHFKSLNYIRGRSFQHSLILIDECQNLTPHQIKTIITRAGSGSKVICLGNLAQIDTPYLNATSSGLTYLSERFKGFQQGGNIQLQGVPRSILAEYAESHL
ncbi:PhoH family protein [Pseudoteredinibacter isoporae]|uniref:PhoH-like ATPase n=1 Tax=Pseudoteredinibacter isoporae TaxID=570281 RepID=A0A7X0JQA8_9GAMM|nr:PhoH family protein [Pseudoteredinibacter isoporae]MBB6520329.1 PhoH-like ATPase [Pseudoteredinibacter isoporae]NHO85900.1 PhoH family protein [Pseudoteredinibacter isoporae]NIB25648.1 PhoH family protein [Pseudoteredinibacter isoporae]